MITLGLSTVVAKKSVDPPQATQPKAVKKITDLVVRVTGSTQREPLKKGIEKLFLLLKEKVTPQHFLVYKEPGKKGYYRVIEGASLQEIDSQLLFIKIIFHLDKGRSLYSTKKGWSTPDEVVNPTSIKELFL